jgi:Mrp family chromosome partitioning ATPase/capsular polysaccharide biosynthesis protein
VEQRPIPAEVRAYRLAPRDQGERSLEIVAIVEGWRLILASCVACVALAAAYALIRPPSFESKVQLLLENQALELFRDEPLVVPTLIGPSQLESQVRIIGSKSLARRVVDGLDLVADPEFAPRSLFGLLPGGGSDPEKRERAAVAQFLKRLEVGSLGLSSVIELGFSSSDPDKAARIAAAVADAYLQDLDRAIDESGAAASAWMRDRLRSIGIRATVISDAAASVTPVGLRVALLLPVAAVAGLALGVALAILRRLFDWNARTSKEVASLIGGELFGSLPRTGDSDQAAIMAAAATSPTLARVEAALEEQRHDRGIVAGVTAPSNDEGATTVALALACRLARHGHEVLLLDANAADPSITLRYQLAGEPGLADVLRGAAYEEIRIVSTLEGFDVLPVGRSHAGDALLQLPAFAHLAHRLGGSYTHVLVDIPPILDSAEVRASAAWIDALLNVAAPPPRRRARLCEAAALMGRARERLLGVVVKASA